MNLIQNIIIRQRILKAFAIASTLCATIGTANLYANSIFKKRKPSRNPPYRPITDSRAATR